MDIDYQAILSVLATAITIYAYIPYLRGIIKGVTKPHFFTWSIWTLTTFVAVAAQMHEGAGVGAWPVLTSAILSLFITLAGLRYGLQQIARSDWYFFIGSIAAIPLWLLTDSPALAAVLVTVIELVATGPTLRKAWKDPTSEVAQTYALNTLRYVLAFGALEQFTIATAAHIVGMFFKHGAILAILLYRRKGENFS